MAKADAEPDGDEAALLALLPADGAPADGNEVRSQLGWVSRLLWFRWC